jgi:hypothetical protein
MLVLGHFRLYNTVYENILDSVYAHIYVEDERKTRKK